MKIKNTKKILSIEIILGILVNAFQGYFLKIITKATAKTFLENRKVTTDQIIEKAESKYSAPEYSKQVKLPSNILKALISAIGDQNRKEILLKAQTITEGDIKDLSKIVITIKENQSLDFLKLCPNIEKLGIGYENEVEYLNNIPPM